MHFSTARLTSQKDGLYSIRLLSLGDNVWFVYKYRTILATTANYVLHKLNLTYNKLQIKQSLHHKAYMRLICYDNVQMQNTCLDLLF